MGSPSFLPLNLCRDKPPDTGDRRRVPMKLLLRAKVKELEERIKKLEGEKDATVL